MDSGEIGVFDEGLGEVYFVDVGEGCEPSEDISELFFEVFAFGGGGGLVLAVVICQRGGEFPKLFGEVEEGARGASGVVGGEIAGSDEFLELIHRDPGGVDVRLAGVSVGG